jgi:hypothetical protein
MRAARLLRLVPALAVLAGCGDTGTDTPPCPPVVLPSLQVRVVDAATGASLSAGAGGSWVSGRYTGVLEPSPVPESDLIVYGPAGRYSLIVTHPGYQIWGRDDIQVLAGQCGPQTVLVRAELVANGP